MLRIDGERGALCSMTKCSTDSNKEIIRKLNRLNEWAVHFKIEDNYIGEIINILQTRRTITHKPILLTLKKRGKLS